MYTTTTVPHYAQTHSRNASLYHLVISPSKIAFYFGSSYVQLFFSRLLGKQIFLGIVTLHDLVKEVCSISFFRYIRIYTQMVSSMMGNILLLSIFNPAESLGLD